MPLPVNSTPLIEVNSEEQLNELLEELRKCKEFAVDLEHHSYRSFMGITCLLQISTRDKDYIIDTFSLRDKLYVLNEVFTMPSIVKVITIVLVTITNYNIMFFYVTHLLWTYIYFLLEYLV